jgi:hypothetical protein
MNAIEVTMESVSELVPFRIRGAIALADQNDIIFDEDRIAGLIKKSSR